MAKYELKLNEDKIKIMEVIEIVKNILYFGIVDKELKFNNHIECIRKKGKKVTFFKRIRDQINITQQLIFITV